MIRLLLYPICSLKNRNYFLVLVVIIYVNLCFNNFVFVNFCRFVLFMLIFMFWFSVLVTLCFPCKNLYKFVILFLWNVLCYYYFCFCVCPLFYFSYVTNCDLFIIFSCEAISNFDRIVPNSSFAFAFLYCPFLFLLKWSFVFDWRFVTLIRYSSFNLRVVEVWTAWWISLYFFFFIYQN